MYRYLIASALTLGTLAATPASAAQPGDWNAMQAAISDANNTKNQNWGR